MHRLDTSGPGAKVERPQVQDTYPVHRLYDGWLDVQRSAISTMDKYVTESMLAFPGGWVEARRFSWSHPLESVCTTSDRCFMLNLTLSGWNGSNSAQSNPGVGAQHEGQLGRVWLIPPEQTLHFRSMEGESRSIRCVLGAELFESFLADPRSWRTAAIPLQEALNIGSGEIEWLLRRMYRELRTPDFATPQVIEMLARQLTVEIIRTFKLGRKDIGFHHGGIAPWRLRLIQQRLWSTQPLPKIEELAELCDMTVRHLSRAFRSETGKTIGKYIETAMVDRAGEMLRDSKPVREVAQALGYASPGSFSTAFRRATGLLPSEVGADGRLRTTTLASDQPPPREGHREPAVCLGENWN